MHGMVKGKGLDSHDPDPDGIWLSHPPPNTLDMVPG
jgi:hypothetical protein